MLLMGFEIDMVVAEPPFTKWTLLNHSHIAGQVMWILVICFSFVWLCYSSQHNFEHLLACML